MVGVLAATHHLPHRASRCLRCIIINIRGNEGVTMAANIHTWHIASLFFPGATAEYVKIQTDERQKKKEKREDNQSCQIKINSIQYIYVYRVRVRCMQDTKRSLLFYDVCVCMHNLPYTSMFICIRFSTIVHCSIRTIRHTCILFTEFHDEKAQHPILQKQKEGIVASRRRNMYHEGAQQEEACCGDDGLRCLFSEIEARRKRVRTVK